MKVGIKERLQIQEILDPQGNMVTIALQRDIRKKLEIGQELMKLVNLTQEGENVKWDSPNDVPVEIEFTLAEMTHLKKCAKEYDAQNKVTDENFDTIKLITEEPSK
jgi:hypothetical protein